MSMRSPPMHQISPLKSVSSSQSLSDRDISFKLRTREAYFVKLLFFFDTIILLTSFTPSKTPSTLDVLVVNLYSTSLFIWRLLREKNKGGSSARYLTALLIFESSLAGRRLVPIKVGKMNSGRVSNISRNTFSAATRWR